MRSRGVVEGNGRRHLETNLLWVDPGFLEIFDFTVVRGSGALDRPGTVLLTPTMAQKYFPNTDPVGRTLEMDRTREVTGIIAAPPGHSSIRFGAVLSLTGDPRLENPGWSPNNFRTYAMLEPTASRSAFEKTLTGIVDRYVAPAYEAGLEEDFPENGTVFYAQPLTDIHLGQGLPVEIESTGIGESTTQNPMYVYLFGALALFVLLLACINFTNLSTARSLERSNEVGVRKSMGADRLGLVGQFLGESILVTAVSLVLAVGICALALPGLNVLSGKDLSLSLLTTPELLAAYVALLFTVGTAAGLYPAFVLARYEPVETLRGPSTSAHGTPLLRQGLVVFQFAISIALIIGTITVERQVDHLTSAGLGFDDENVVVIDHVRQLQNDVAPVKEALAQHASVKQVAGGFSVPSGFFINSMWQADTTNAENRNLNYSYVDPGYIDLLQVDVVAGRSFSADRGTDSTATVLNRAAASRFGWSPEEALGQRIKNGPNGDPMTVIGVVENFHYASLHNEVSPLALFHSRANWHQRKIAVRLQPGQAADGLEAVRAAWGQFSDLPLEQSFLSDRLAAQYEAEQRMERLFVIFAGLAILIACLGLFGLAAYSARQRTKEIGIRKALGATVQSVITLVSKDFLLLVGIAFGVASPIAYLAMQQWLASFAYRIDLGVSIFAVAGVLAFLIAAATVSTQAWRAARIDPTTALRAE